MSVPNMTLPNPSRLGLQNTPTAFLQRSKTPRPTSVLIWHQTIWWWSSSNAGAFGNVEYHFIAITPRSTLALSGRTLFGPIYLAVLLDPCQIELFNIQTVLMLNWIVWNRTVFTFYCVQNMSSDLFKNFISKISLEIKYLIYMYKNVWALYIIIPNKTKFYIFNIHI